MISISNDRLAVTVNEKGAELQSLQLDGREYLWQADPKFWSKRSPVLFPIVGELKDGKYLFAGKEYKLPRHGFARDKTFDVKQLNAGSVIFTLASDEETFNVFPFHFDFQIEYTLGDVEIFCTYIVHNAGSDVMFFSVGGHPAFNVPLNRNLVHDDYYLAFDNDNTLQRHLLRDGLLSDETELIELNDKRLALTPGLFYKDAVVLKHINSKQITLRTDNDPHGLTFKFEDFPYFGIWAAKDAPFVCLEPWCGVADNIHHDNQLIQKEGIIELQPAATWQRTWSVELF